MILTFQGETAQEVFAQVVAAARVMETGLNQLTSPTPVAALNAQRQVVDIMLTDAPDSMPEQTAPQTEIVRDSEQLAAAERQKANQPASTSGDKATTATAAPVTKEQVKAKLNEVVAAASIDAAGEIVNEFGAASLSSLKPEFYLAVVTRCEQVLGEKRGAVA